MCGIFCSVSRTSCPVPPDAIRTRLVARGPDATNEVTIKCPARDASTTNVRCCSTVLSLRGDNIVSQPFQKSGSDSTLCWNGEAWRINGKTPRGNDTESIFDLLSSAVYQAASSTGLPSDTGVQHVARALSSVEGPYAFVFYDALAACLYFGRDFLGRRSLLWQGTLEGDLLLSSVTDDRSSSAYASFAEVDADGIYCIDLSASSPSPDEKHLPAERWGDFSITKLPYMFHDRGVRNDNSVGTRTGT